MYDIAFFINCILLGLALAADAFSVSVANGMAENGNSFKRAALISGTFGFFQFLMPLLGWFLVHSFVAFFSLPKFVVPLAAMVILCFLGVKMLVEAKKDSSAGATEKEAGAAVGFGAILLQGVATSLDALSVGLTISDYEAIKALVCSLVIGAVTFAACIIGVVLGKTFKKAFSSVAGIIGGIILIIIGVEIFIRGII